MKTPQFVQIYHEDAQAIGEELIRGLTTPDAQGGAWISPKFLYDALGSRLFEAITELPEYYPTRTEAQIFSTHGAAMATLLPQQATLIDLGAGNCAKAASLFERLAPVRYVAVDISVDFLRGALTHLQREYPCLDMVGVGMDFSASLDLPPEAGALEDGPRILFYPGSSIGNFTPEQALVFLKQVRAACGPVAGSGLLIGVDLLKDTAELEAAYDDALGVTAAFNRNLLLHINRLVGSDLRVADWAHRAIFNADQSRIEMHLVARRSLTVRWPGGSQDFAQGAHIHTENSYKWTLAGFSQLLREAGFAEASAWTDAPADTPAGTAGRFAVLWAPTQEPSPCA
ncbi:MAG: L-histidine N(alpha)-methyltransferase [Burkholderiales bacterium PBB3]|nr:MAG: L-histidine N(alpha)-methyltransferase [Burkholderiales bacterium PBB3]